MRQAVNETKRLRTKVLLLFIIAAIPRLTFLGTVPAGVNFDESDYILNAKAVFYAWTDLTGQWNPLSLSTLPGEDPKGELPAVLLAPFIGPLPFSMFTARFPFAILGILSVVLLYLIGRKLFGEAEGFLSSLVLALNPLAIFNSRISYDIPIATAFFLIAFTTLLYARGWFLLLSTVSLFVAFYSYAGAKLLFLPFTALAIYTSWKVVRRRQFTKQYLVIAILSGLIFVHFLIRLPQLASYRRLEGILTPLHPVVVREVDEQRRLSLVTPIPQLERVSVNKIVIYTKELINRFFGAFSTQVLFTAGDTYHFFYLWDHGVFYFTDAVLLMLGIFYLFLKYRRVVRVFVSLLVIFLLPALFSGTEASYVYRANLFYTFLAMLIGIGLWNVLKTRNKPRWIVPVLALLYILQFYNFAYDYLVRNPVYHESQFQLTYRVLNRYLAEEGKGDRKIVVIGIQPKHLFQQYILHSGLVDQLGNSQIRGEIAQKFRTREHDYEEYLWGNVEFTYACKPPTPEEEETIILRDDRFCANIENGPIKNNFAIARISDSGQEFRIYGGQTCENTNSGKFIRSVGFFDLQIEKIPLDRFCKTYITSNLEEALGS